MPWTVIAAAAGGVITLALLMARGISSSDVAAAHEEAATPATPAPAGSGHPLPVVVKWNTEHQAEWIGRQKNSAAFELPAENTVPIWLGQVRPILVVRCMSKRTEVFVFTGSAIKIEPKTEDHTVTFSFDEQPELTERWPDSDEHDALFAPDGGSFADRLARARTLRFGYTPHNVAPVVAHFQVSGLGELIAPLAKECGRKDDTRQ
jgi:hypothetical protein